MNLGSGIYSSSLQFKDLPLSQQIENLENRGFGFEASGEFEIPTSGVNYTILSTGSKSVILHSRIASYDGVGFNAFIYRDPVFSGGVEAEVNQPNDVSPNENTAVIITGATVSSIGTQTRMPIRVFGNTSNQGMGDSLELIGSPQIILPNKSILLVFENRDSNAAQNIASHLRWVEAEGSFGGFIIQNGQFAGWNGIV